VDTLAKQREASRKPFLAITHPGHVEDVMAEMRGKLLERGVAAFTSFDAAARAQARAVQYWRRREGLD
jgi:hypothetical protein